MRADGETGLYRKGHCYYALQAVPAEHREMLKRSWYSATLRTSNRREAIRLLPSARAKLQDRIERETLDKLGPWLEAQKAERFDKALQAINIQAEIHHEYDNTLVVKGRFTRYDHNFELRLTDLESSASADMRRVVVCAIRDYLTHKANLNRPTHLVVNGQQGGLSADVTDVAVALPQVQTAADATALADQLADEVKEVTRRLGDQKYRLEAVVESYVKLQGVGPQYADEARMAAREFGADRRVDEITDRDVIKYRDQLLESKAPATVTKRLTVLKSALGYARDHGMVPANVAAGVKSPKKGKAAKVPTAETTRELNKLIIDNLPEHRGTRGTAKQRADEQRLIHLLIYTGMRIEDGASIDCSRVREHPDGFVYLQIRGGKSDANIRDIPLHPELEGSVRAWRDERQTGPLFPHLKPGAKYGKSSTYADKNLNRFLKDTVQTDVRCHGLRHGFITMARNAGWTNAETGRYVGHETGSITDHYGSPHSLPYMRDKIANLKLVA